MSTIKDSKEDIEVFVNYELFKRPTIDILGKKYKIIIKYAVEANYFYYELRCVEKGVPPVLAMSLPNYKSLKDCIIALSNELRVIYKDVLSSCSILKLITRKEVPGIGVVDDDGDDL